MKIVLPVHAVHVRFLTTFHGLHAISTEIIQFRIAAIIHVHMTYVKPRPWRGGEMDTVCAVSYAAIAPCTAGRVVRRSVGGIHRELPDFLPSPTTPRQNRYKTFK